MPEPGLSALVIARNEAANLERCLRSVSFADERIVVVDSSSDDGTLEVAHRCAEVVSVREFDHFAGQRNASLALARGRWVLAIDADECATPELVDEIQAIVHDPSAQHVGFRVPIRSMVLGRRFRFSGTQHDLPLRLFRRNAGCWTGLVHETVAIEGPIGRLEGFLDHLTLANVSDFLQKIDRYTSLEARQRFESGARFGLQELFIRPPWTFLKLYLGKLGLLDGLEGLAFCGLSGLSAAVRGWKLRELEGAAKAAGDDVEFDAAVIAAKPGKALGRPA